MLAVCRPFHFRSPVHAHIALPFSELEYPNLDTQWKTGFFLVKPPRDTNPAVVGLSSIPYSAEG